MRLFASVVLDVVLSSLLAPIRMAFHSRFVFTNLIGRTVVWRSAPREDAETSWATRSARTASTPSSRARGASRSTG
jgi:membrane glycosyltransferase